MSRKKISISNDGTKRFTLLVKHRAGLEDIAIAIFNLRDTARKVSRKSVLAELPTVCFYREENLEYLDDLNFGNFEMHHAELIEEAKELFPEFK